MIEIAFAATRQRLDGRESTAQRRRALLPKPAENGAGKNKLA